MRTPSPPSRHSLKKRNSTTPFPSTSEFTSQDPPPRFFEADYRKRTAFNYGLWLRNDLVPTQAQFVAYKRFLLNMRDNGYRYPVFTWDEGLQVVDEVEDDDVQVDIIMTQRRKIQAEFKIVTIAKNKQIAVKDARDVYRKLQEEAKARLQSNPFSTTPIATPGSPPIVVIQSPSSSPGRPSSSVVAPAPRPRFSFSSLFSCIPSSPKPVVNTQPTPVISLEKLAKIASICSHYKWKVDFYWFSFGWAGKRTNKHTDSSQAFRNKLVPDTVAFILEIANKYCTFSNTTVSPIKNVKINEVEYEKDMAKVWKKLTAPSCTRDTDTRQVYEKLITFIKDDQLDSTLESYVTHVEQPSVPGSSFTPPTNQ